MKLINPLQIPERDLPLIVLSGNATNFISWAIKWKTKSSYNHAMILYGPGKLASQGFRFTQRPITDYMKSNCRMKFWKIKSLTFVQKLLVKERIERHLKKPFWKRRYDWIGTILGQGLGIKWLQSPFSYYCSEITMEFFKGLIQDVPERESPAGLNQIFKEQDVFEYYGHFLGD